MLVDSDFPLDPGPVFNLELDRGPRTCAPRTRKDLIAYKSVKLIGIELARKKREGFVEESAASQAGQSMRAK
ncbi:hypothetical protein EVAR_3619_1 [Eumeta japonica]|uniref:Uncharacterized protein n=1 Tax=Eumeta variegata TaxID=151549 RepID=A0A4C1SYE3_EUMVA|nr:hypothetical protein EVAR_3619_1 [Eumeta japonica]